MFEDANNIADIFRIGLPYYVLLTLPILIICSSNPVLASSDFSVQRMTQYDINGVYFGCRSSSLSLEARSLFTWSTARHCVVAKFQDMTVDQFREIRQKAGGLVLLLPKNFDSLSIEEKEHLCQLERVIMEQSVTIPVYFSVYNPKLEDIIADITRGGAKKNDDESNTTASKIQTKQRESALSEVFNSISANGYQIIVTGASHASNKNSKIPIIQGELAPAKLTKFVDGVTDPNSKLPMIIVAADLKTFGMFNDYPLNADAAVLITLADMFSKLHNTINAALKYRILFLLTESGPLLNYQGVKKWLDENVQLQNVDFILCLDSISRALISNETNLYMHVSKPPKENTPINTFLKHLKYLSNKYINVTTEGIHKKINLAEPQLAWHHERFSIKRLPSFTLSSLKSPKHLARTSIFKDKDHLILAQTQRNAKIIAEALARYIYGKTALEEFEDFEIFSGSMQISSKLIKSYMNLKSALHNNDLKNSFEKYLKNVKITYEKPEVRDPDFMLYEGLSATLNVYHVKPAVFDLFLTIIICSYLCFVYFVIQFFPNMYQVICKMCLKSLKLTPIHNNYVERSKTKSY